ncbi:phosphate ABC transporter substrate-binding protein [Phormidesmis priestleyi ULC007]|uniref:Phosphate ABC transporter substrate-binding protein n=1 Tax=Phormidesmis priestleyi ULC007 TaxID=1920490 RepID=A0A2T1DED6_9CYAN|nr:PstS family phosphate ABC transporter substrate-binding protein [Phormidesmis priestleyi]PSB18835.1 phosphate ABC transporter substrate-binding protein [Phormidesmis priestleyi ULC007]PZO51026.1 MAG: phosphate ABC transporter substrate-binding protein [Phormidesmis priestleyi]
MSQKNETPALILSLLVTSGLLGGGFWWFTQRSGFDASKVALPNPQNSATPSANSSSQPNPSATNLTQQPLPSGRFSYGGSTSWATIRLSVDPVLQAAHPEFQLRYVNPIGSPPSSGAGIKMLLDGQIAFAQSSRPVSDQEYQQAQQRGFSLKQIAVAIDGLAVAVNPGLNVAGLTIDQLKAIYSGQVKNWQEVGGSNVPIVPLFRSSSTQNVFGETVLAGQQPGGNVQIVSTTTQALQKLAATPGGVYFASAPEVVPQCTVKPLAIGKSPGQFVPPYQAPLVTNCPTQRNQLNIQAFQNGSYPITRNLFVVVKQNGGTEQQAGEAYANLLLSDQGQDAIAKAGFVRVR